MTTLSIVETFSTMLAWSHVNPSLAGGLIGGVLTFCATTMLVAFLISQQCYWAFCEKNRKRRRKIALARRLRLISKNINLYATQYTNDQVRLAEGQASFESKNPISASVFQTLEECWWNMECSYAMALFFWIYYLMNFSNRLFWMDNSGSHRGWWKYSSH